MSVKKSPRAIVTAAIAVFGTANVGVCRAGVANGKVTSLESKLEGD